MRSCPYLSEGGILSWRKLHIDKVIASVAILAFPVFALVVSTSSYFTYCYDFAGNRLTTADGISNNYGVAVCDNFLFYTPYVLFLLPAWIGGIWLLIFGLTGRSLMTGKKEPRRPVQMHLMWIALSGLLLLVSSIYLLQFIAPVIQWCPRNSDSVLCIEPLNMLPLTLGIVIPLILTSVWLIQREIKKIYPVRAGLSGS